MGTIVFLILRLVFGYNYMGDVQTLATVLFTLGMSDRLANPQSS